MSYELAPGGGAWTVDEALAAARCTLVRSASASRVERQGSGCWSWTAICEAYDADHVVHAKSQAIDTVVLCTLDAPRV